uniref:Uncharacterized protein n=1 Tax=Ditylenchus dipsaci TaxID=166011 RepID=A0A915DDQ7_9BILA
MEVKRARQNSIPTMLRASPITRSVRIMEEKKRRKSYDVRPIQASFERHNPNTSDVVNMIFENLPKKPSKTNMVFEKSFTVSRGNPYWNRSGD